MAFLPLIPQPTDRISVSQGNILNNFTILGSIAGNTNPSSSSLNTTAGFNWVYLPPNGAIPPSMASFPSGNIGLYSAANSVTGQNELYINKTNQATVVQVAATASSLSVTSAPANGSSGWSYLPSGVLMKWGQTTAINASDPFPFLYPTGANIPAFNAVFTVLITDIDANSGGAPFDHVVTIQSGTISATGFSLIYHSTPPATTIVNYLAIGY